MKQGSRPAPVQPPREAVPPADPVHGKTLQQVAFAGPSPFPPGAGAELEIVHYSHENYGVVVEVRELPICRLNYHYEVWLTGYATGLLVESREGRPGCSIRPRSASSTTTCNWPPPCRSPGMWSI